ncbi:MAG: sulfatase [Nitrososphaerota archaeon]|nr:sulfatase [Nitrososphaerota archaeon]
MNVIVIVSDTFRKDHLGLYGGGKARTPNLDRFGNKCVAFENCYGNSFPTVPTRADLSTGRLSFAFMGWEPLPADEPTVSQMMSKERYVTAAVADTPFFTGNNGFNFDRGFSDYTAIRGQKVFPQRVRQEWISQRRHETDYFAPATMLAAERWLQKHYKEKFFLYVDTWDPHEPWDPPAWYVEQYYPQYDGRTVEPCYGRYKERGVSEEDLRIAHACYCGEVSMVDRWIGRLLDTVEYLNLMDDTMIVFLSDHGYYFGEHGFFGKAVMETSKIVQDMWEVVPEDLMRAKDWRAHIYRSPLYEEAIRVPLLAYVPGVKPKKSKALVSLTDVPATILDMCNIKPDKEMHGVSLKPHLEGDNEAGKEFVVTSWPLCKPGERTGVIDSLGRTVVEFLPSTITTPEWSLLYAAKGEPVELYNLASDPKQQKNVYEENKDVAKDLHRRFYSMLDRLGTSESLLKDRSSL